MKEKKIIKKTLKEEYRIACDRISELDFTLTTIRYWLMNERRAHYDELQKYLKIVLDQANDLNCLRNEYNDLIMKKKGL